jgi:hypothetical protein
MNVMQFPWKIVRKRPEKFEQPKNVLEALINPIYKKDVELIIKLPYALLSILDGASKSAKTDEEKMPIEELASKLIEAGLMECMAKAIFKNNKPQDEDEPEKSYFG